MIFKQEFFTQGNVNSLFAKLSMEYNQPGRFYHNWNHIETMLEAAPDEASVELYLAICFHDIVYDLQSSINEERSCEELDQWVHYKRIPFEFDLQRTKDLIMLTKNHDPKYLCYEWNGTDEQKIVHFDLKALLECDFKTMKKNDGLLFKEFQKTPLNKYKEGRQNFLFSFYNNFNSHLVNSTGFYQYIKSLEQETYNIGIAVGSYNPFHIGHMNIIEKAEKVFDKVIIGVGQNPDKERNSNLNYLQNKIYREVMDYSTIPKLFDYLKGVNPKDKFTLIRGLRNGWDLQQEDTFRYWVDKLSNGTIDIVYFFCDPYFEHISSSGLRGIQKAGIDIKEYLV